MSMAVCGYKRLGLDIYIEWNNRKFLSGIIKLCGINDEDISKVILSVDKLAKIGKKLSNCSVVTLKISATATSIAKSAKRIFPLLGFFIKFCSTFLIKTRYGLLKI